MAGELEPLAERQEAEDAEGQALSLKKTEDLLETVKKLQKEGSLEPQIEDLIHRINELQQAKKKSSEELGEAQALQEALHWELHSLNGEKVHLEEVLSKKQEALRILQQHCQERENETQWKGTVAEYMEHASVYSFQVAESRSQDSGVTPSLRLDTREQLGEQLQDLSSQHKDLWEFHVLEQRLSQEIRALKHSREQLLADGTLLRARLQEAERRLRAAREAQGAAVPSGGLKTEREEFGEQSRGAPEARAGGGEARLEEEQPQPPESPSGSPC